MSHNVKISVIIPIYNVEPYLSRCLDSLTDQTLKDTEIICINDCSTDNSLTILQKYAAKDNRIKIINFSSKQNAAIARNAGLKIATGEYLGFIDSDDFVDLNFYEELYKKATHENADIAKCECKIVELDGQVVLSTRNQVIAQTNKNFFTCEWWSAVYKHSMIKENNISFPEECPKAQDIVFLNKAVLAAQKLSLVNDVFYHYVRREASLDCKKLSIEHCKSAFRALDIIMTDINKSGLYNDDENSYIKLYTEKLMIMLTTAFQTDEQGAKMIFADAFEKSYQQCSKKDGVDKVFTYKFIIDLIKKNQKDTLVKELMECKNINQLIFSELRYNLKKGSY